MTSIPSGRDSAKCRMVAAHAPVGGNPCANRIRQHGSPADVATSLGCDDHSNFLSVCRSAVRTPTSESRLIRLNSRVLCVSCGGSPVSNCRSEVSKRALQASIVSRLRHPGRARRSACKSSPTSSTHHRYQGLIDSWRQPRYPDRRELLWMSLTGALRNESRAGRVCGPPVSTLAGLDAGTSSAPNFFCPHKIWIAKCGRAGQSARRRMAMSRGRTHKGFHEFCTLVNHGPWGAQTTRAQ